MTQLAAWHDQKTKKWEIQKSGFYILSPKAKIDLLFNKIKKYYTLQFYQLKIEHEPIGTFLKKIKAKKTANC